MNWREKIHHTTGADNGHYQSNMDWIQKMNHAMDYIEIHLDDRIDYHEVAGITQCSVYHFQRFFSFLAEMPLSEYIRRRRLTQAAFELQNSDIKVIDAALKYGYESPEAFARAFKGMHGMAPTSARKKGVRLKAYPCITFHISLKGESEMNYRIEQRETLEMYGVETEISTADNQNFISVPMFWETCRKDGTIDAIRRAGQIGADVPLHAAMYNCTDHSHTYMIGYFSPASGAPGGFSTVTIPASTWAVFPTGALPMPEAARQSGVMWKRIFTEWFATSGYELAVAPEMELHHQTGDGLYVTEIWIPIVKNK